MSGGFLRYLSSCDVPDLFDRLDDLEYVFEVLYSLDFDNIAFDVELLIETIYKASLDISKLSNNLEKVFYDVELFLSNDINEDDLIKRLFTYKSK